MSARYVLADLGAFFMDKILYELSFGHWLRLTPSLYQVTSELSTDYVIQTVCRYLFLALFDNFPDSYMADDRSLIIGSSHSLNSLDSFIDNWYLARHYKCLEESA